MGRTAGEAMEQTVFASVNALTEAQVVDLHALYQGEWWTRGRRLEDVATMVGGPGLVFGLVTDPEGRLAAFARVLTDGVYKALVFDVIVAPAFRNLGLGRQLMKTIVKHPTLDVVKHLELYCLPDMVPFYERWGFSTDVSGVTFMRRRAR
jgi:GNAT superfamily N-acetyltransferase